MWNPERIEIQNLFAHKCTVYEFKNNTCTVIFGKNETDKGMTNNGAGKTTLFEAVCIALTNDSLRNIRKDSFINYNAEDCTIDLTLQNPVLNKTLRIVRRFFRKNRPVQVEIWENGVLNTQITSVAEANKRVYELIGIGREDLLRYFIIGQDNRYTFFTASDTEKKEILNRITSADMINPVLEQLDAENKQLNAFQDALRGEVDKLYAKKEIIEEQRREAAKQDDIDEELKRIDEKISENESQLDVTTQTLQKFSTYLKQKEQELQNIIVPDLTKLRQQRQRLQQQFNEQDKLLNATQRTMRKLKTELEDAITCPSCGYEFVHESDLDLAVEDIKRLMKEAEIEINKQTKTLKQLEQQLKTVLEKIEIGEQEEEKYKKLQLEIKDLQRRITYRKDEQGELLIKIEKLNKQKQDIKLNKQKNKLLEDLKKREQQLDVEINELNSKILPVQEQLEKVQFWQFHMGRSGFQTYLANKAIKILEGTTNMYLEKMKIDYRVMITPFTVLKSGDVREKIDCFITDNGRDAKNFMAYSGGERQRVTLAGILAIQRLINLSLNGGGLNLLLLDESLGNIDTFGTTEIVRILENLGITVMLITQNVEDSSIFKNAIQVVKRGGVSSFI